jgi:hypothetical protein
MASPPPIRKPASRALNFKLTHYPAAGDPERRGGDTIPHAKCGDGVEQPPAMPHQGDTEILQILGREAREHLFIDLIIAERLFVTLETQAAQPRRYVDAVILGSEEQQPHIGDDRPLAFALPATALKYAQRRVCPGVTQ